MKLAIHPLLAALVLLAALGSARAQEQRAEPVIAPEAEVVLRQWGEHHRQLQSAVIRVSDSIDDVMPDGQKLQFSHTREFTLVRPDKMKVETTGDVVNRIMWKDGTTITVLDTDTNFYAQLPDPGSIEQAVTMLQDDYGMSLPAADLLADDALQAMIELSNAIEYIGIGFVGDERCHHLAFIGEMIDWQVWIAAGDVPALRKMIICYKRLRGEPQYTLQVVAMSEGLEIADSVFECKLPGDAEEITFHPIRKSD